MNCEPHKKRLDEILLDEGLISEAEIQEALLRQKAQGGKFGSQLLYHRYIDEAGLVTALSVQLGCAGIELSGLDIPEAVIELVPRNIALTRKVMPFEYDATQNVLKIACEDPTDRALANELSFVTSGKQVELFVAAELVLNTAIARYYLGQDVSTDANLLWEIPEATVGAGKSSIPDELDGHTDHRPVVLLVSDESQATLQLHSVLGHDDYRIVIADSIPQALDLSGSEKFHTVLINDNVPGDRAELIDRLRKLSPRTIVRRFDTASSLLLAEDHRAADPDLLLKNLDLFTSLLSAKAKLPANHSGQVGRYVDKLCRKLGLPAADRVLISNAAYIHDLAWFYQSAEEAEDSRQVIERTVKLLSSLAYPPVVLEILGTMYRELPQRYTHHLPLEVLGGNILTVVDLFCDSIPQSDRLAPGKVDAVKRKLRRLAGKLFLTEVVNAFIEMMQEEILDLHITSKASQVMIYAEDLALQQLLEMLLKNEGYRTVSHSSPATFIELYQRSEPDLMIIAVQDEPDSIIAFVDQLADGGIKFERTPAFIVTDRSAIPRLSGLAERGVEDIVPLGENLDLLLDKLRGLPAKLGSGGEGEFVAPTSGARGRLADMSLVDLLQALGPSRKTVLITVQPGQPGAAPLTVFLDEGAIIFAELTNLTGAEAVYQGLTWTDGVWTAEPVNPGELPTPNNRLSNESILMEGCRLMDERVKAGYLL